MKLNLPIIEQLEGSQQILIAGMGGGFDVYSGVPLYLELKERGFNVHLANFSFADVIRIESNLRLSTTMIGVHAGLKDNQWYFPELYLSQWFREQRDEDVTIWAFHKTGVQPLLENYRMLVERLEIDAIVLVDGGVDSLMRGDEHAPGTILEDSISLAAMDQLTEVPLRLTAAIGLGIEPEVGYSHLFENLAELTKIGAFLGSCSLVRSMPVVKQYEEAVMFAFNKIPYYKSVICSSVVAALRGEYGNFHLTERTNGSVLRISALMPIYWFFDLPKVAERNLLLSQLLTSQTAQDALRIVLMVRGLLDLRPYPPSPLPNEVHKT